MAGNANDFDFAASSISAYFSGVAMGMRLGSSKVPTGCTTTGWPPPTLVPPTVGQAPVRRGNRGRILCPSPADRAAAPPAPEIHVRASTPVVLPSGSSRRWRSCCCSTGCGAAEGGRPPVASKAADDKPDAARATSEASTKSRPPTPGSRPPRIGTCHPDDLRPVAAHRSLRRARRAAVGRHTTVVSRVVFLPEGRSAPPPRSPDATPSASATAPRPTASCRRHPRRPGHLDADLDAVHARARTSSCAAPAGCAATCSRAAATSSSRSTLAAPAAGQGGARDSCASARPRRRRRLLRPAARLPRRGRLPCASVRPTRTQSTFTPTARDRCQQLVGSYGGFWQPPSRAGWDTGDRFIRCLVRQS